MKDTVQSIQRNHEMVSNLKLEEYRQRHRDLSHRLLRVRDDDILEVTVR